MGISVRSMLIGVLLLVGCATKQSAVENVAAAPKVEAPAEALPPLATVRGSCVVATKGQCFEHPLEVASCSEEVDRLQWKCKAIKKGVFRAAACPAKALVGTCTVKGKPKAFYYDGVYEQRGTVGRPSPYRTSQSCERKGGVWQAGEVPDDRAVFEKMKADIQAMRSSKDLCEAGAAAYGPMVGEFTGVYGEDQAVEAAQAVAALCKELGQDKTHAQELTCYATTTDERELKKCGEEAVGAWFEAFGKKKKAESSEPPPEAQPAAVLQISSRSVEEELAAFFNSPRPAFPADLSRLSFGMSSDALGEALPELGTCSKFTPPGYSGFSVQVFKRKDGSLDYLGVNAGNVDVVSVLSKRWGPAESREFLGTKSPSWTHPEDRLRVEFQKGRGLFVSYYLPRSAYFGDAPATLPPALPALSIGDWMKDVKARMAKAEGGEWRDREGGQVAGQFRPHGVDGVEIDFVSDDFTHGDGGRLVGVRISFRDFDPEPMLTEKWGPPKRDADGRAYWEDPEASFEDRKRGKGKGIRVFITPKAPGEQATLHYEAP